jgi:hypothetical protein
MKQSVHETVHVCANIAGRILMVEDDYDLVAISGLAIYANVMADATAMEPDKMFTLL